MSIASRIQEIETHIGDVYDTINYSYDTTGVNKNIINIPKYLNKGYIDIINNGIDTLYNNFPKVSGIGSNLSLTPTYEAPMKLNEIQGNTLQDGTPTPDTPVPIQSVTGRQEVNVCGKNLFDKSTITTGKYIDASGNLVNDNSNFTGDYIPIDNTKSYYASQNAGGVIRVGYYNSSKTFISRQLISANYGSLEIPNNTKYIRLSCYNQSLDTLQLEIGSSSTTYEQYNGNTYEVNLGKNLLDYSTLQDGYCNNIGGITTTHEQGEMYSEFIKVQPNTTYTFKIFETGSAYDNWIGIGEYTANNLSSFIQRITMTTTTQNYYTFTTSATTQYIIVSARNLAQATKIQLEKGQATSYSPYFTPIELNKIGDYQDRIYKDNGKWYLEKQIGKVVLDGSETYTSASTNTSEKYRIRYSGVVDLIKRPTTSGTVGDIISNQFIPTYANNTYRCNQGISAETNGTITFYDETITQSITAFTTWLSTHNTEVYYALATPTYTEITNTELINQLEALNTAKSQEGTTNISITSEDLEMILNVSALKGEE